MHLTLDLSRAGRTDDLAATVNYAEVASAVVARITGPSFDLIERLAVIIRQSNDRIMDLSTLGAYTRVYAEILRLARTLAKEDADTALIDPLPVHSDLAARCGTTRETVARAISDLIKKGVAEKQGSGLNIKDLWGLKDIVEGGDEG